MLVLLQNPYFTGGSGTLYNRFRYGGSPTYDTNTPFNKTGYYFYVFRFDGSFGDVYINNVRMIHTSFTNALDFTGFKLTIGKYLESGAINGQIDEFGVWNRDLSNSELTTIYNNGIGLSYPFGVVTTGKNIFSISNNLTTNYNYTNATNPQCNLNINFTGYLYNTSNNFDFKLYINGTLNSTYNNKVFDSNNATEINFSFKNMDGQYNFSFVANNTALSNFTNKNIALSCIEGFHPVDTTPPKISNINNVSVTNNSVYISFDLNELAFYSPSVGTIFSACNNNSPINYSYVIGTNYYNITGLINNSKYCGIINAVDLNSNANQSDYFWFTTLNNTWTVTPPSNDTGNNGNNNTVSYNITGIETQLSNFNDNFKTWSLIFLSLVMIIVTIVSIKLTEFMYLLFICPIAELAGYFIYYDNLPMFRNLGFLICMAYFVGYVIISFIAVFVTMQNKKSAENKKRTDAQFYNRNNFYR